MKILRFASIALATLRRVSWRRPTRCPYCPSHDRPHWTRWGFYERYAEGSDRRIRIQRYLCKIVGRTLSLLPDSVLPYHFHTTARILRWLHALTRGGMGIRTLARRESVPRSTLRRLRARFLRVAPVLRLPEHPAALAPADFMAVLARTALDRLADLFVAWKEIEPKHSVVGMFAR